MPVKTYRKRPIMIKALEWTGENLEEMERFLGTGLIASPPDGAGYLVECKQQLHLMIKTLEGDHRANIGDFIIKGIAGEFYPCKPKIFADSYDIDEKLGKEDMLVSITVASSELVNTKSMIYYKGFPKKLMETGLFRDRFVVLQDNDTKFQCLNEFTISKVE